MSTRQTGKQANRQTTSAVPEARPWRSDGGETGKLHSLVVVVLLVAGAGPLWKRSLFSHLNDEVEG